MADVSVQMGVSGVAQFKQSMQQAQASVKTMDAALKLNEKQYKATGDAEAYMQNKTTALNSKLQAQQNAVKSAEAALKTMKASGVDPLSVSYQNMERQLLNAQAAMLETQTEINELGTESADASGKTDELASSLGGLNKKISLDQVIKSIDSITGGMERAAQKAAELSKQLWDSIMDAAARADDTETMAMMYGIDLQTFKQMQQLVTNGMDTSVEAMLSAQDKLKKGIGSGSEAVMEQLRSMGLLTQVYGKFGSTEIIPQDSVKLFWEAGQAIMQMEDAYQKEAAAQALFGRGWKELVPLFSTYKNADEYNAALEGTVVSSEDATRNLAELNDAVETLEGTWTSLKDEILGAIAPALTGGVQVLSDLLSKVMEYLQTPEGQKALEDMGKAVEGLFKDLSSIDPEKVVEGFSGVFTTIVSGLEWLSTNSGAVISAMEAIVVGWGALKLTGGILTIAQLIQGITGLGSGAAAGAGAAGAAAGASWGGAFASAVMKAAPWLAGLVTLLTPGSTATNDQDILFDEKTGQMTSAGWESFYNQSGPWPKILADVGEIFGDLGSITSDAAAINALGKLLVTGDREAMIRELEALGYVRRDQPQAEPESPFPKAARYDELGAMYDEAGNYFGTRVNTTGQTFHKDRRTGERTYIEPEAVQLPEGEKVELPTELEPPPEGSAEQVAQQVGTIRLPVTLEWDRTIGGASGRWPTDWNAWQTHANGLPMVPFDGYRAILHKGERVVPAREVGNSRNFSSNLYVESMYMNNGQDADGLAAAMAAAQRRTMSGYGS